MVKQRALFALFLFSLLLNSCNSGPDTADQSERVQTKVVVAPDGSIHLKPEQIQANGIQTSEVTETDVTPSINATGRVKARAGGEAQVFSPFPGKLIADSARLPRPGDFVKQGQLIGEVEQQFVASERLQMTATTVQLEAGIEQAQQEVNLRQTEVNRAQQLYDGGAIPLKQLQSAQFDLKAATSKLEGAVRTKQQYEEAQSQSNGAARRAPITVPISGTVMSMDLAGGQQVDPSKALLTVVDLNDVWIEAAVHENDLPHTRHAKSAEVQAPGTHAVSGRLVTIGNLVDPENRTVPVTFNVANPGTTLKIGMFVAVRIPTGPSARALTIPASAILPEQGAASVFVETQPGVYVRKPVMLGEHAGDAVVVVGGLSKGDRVVSTGAQMLRSESLKAQIPVEDVGEKR
jgi:cobalt-zinc-cadmium efflux system membrane fusion protein